MINLKNGAFKHYQLPREIGTFLGGRGLSLFTVGLPHKLVSIPNFLAFFFKIPHLYSI